MPRLTLYGMINWDNDLLLSGMVLPPGMDKQTMQDWIIDRAGDLYPYYQVPDKIKLLSGQWFKRKLYNFTCMYNALTVDYNPIHNYDRVEDKVETPDITHDISGQSGNMGSTTSHTTGNNTSTGTGSNISNTNGTESGSNSQHSTVTNNVSAFDSAAYVARDQQITDTGGTTSGQHNADTTTNTTQDAKDDMSEDTAVTSSSNHIDTRKDHESGTRTTHSTVKGNIGVTTTQEMITSELELRMYDLYDIIADEWINDFIITIY